MHDHYWGAEEVSVKNERCPYFVRSPGGGHYLAFFNCYGCTLLKGPHSPQTNKYPLVSSHDESIFGWIAVEVNRLASYNKDNKCTKLC